MLAPGTVLQGRYKIISLLAQGGMGAVYMAKDQRLGSTVALKETFFKDEVLRKAFEREARLLANLRHPALVKVTDHFGEDDNRCLVMEFIPGEDLAHMLSSRGAPFPAAQVKSWADQLLDALDYLHTQPVPIVHRDIKPQNMKLTERGQIILLDFGLAKGLAAGMSLSSSNVSMFGYTPHYAPPEQVNGMGTDPRTDLYSLAASLYHLATGKLPADSLSRLFALSQSKPDPLVSVDELVHGTQTAFCEAIAKAMAMNPDDRPGSASEMRSALRPVSPGGASRSMVDQLPTVVGGENPGLPPAGTPVAHPTTQVRTFRTASNLPAQVTALIGRDQELAELNRMLLKDDTRLVTLTGAGGTGKTRLASELAKGLTGVFGDGVFFIPLADVGDPEQVIWAIAQSLEVKEDGKTPLAEMLKERLLESNALLLVDNFEQVISAAPLIADLLASCPRLKVLITSREPLHLRGEVEYEVSPLELPGADDLTVESVTLNPAVALFVERARAVKSGFGLTEENARAVADVCARLDGLPLAIELAAARIKLLSPQAILSRLENRLKLLTISSRDLPDRQRTMNNAISWSYDLLDDSNKALFRRLAVFAGGFTLEAAEDLCAHVDADIEILDALASLVEKSLLRQQEQPDYEPRFSMLGVIRDFGLQRLAESGGADAARAAHADYFLALVESAASEMRGKKQVTSLRQIEREYGNIRAALEWAKQTGRAEHGLRMAGALWWFWDIQCYFTEGRMWLRDFLQAAPREVDSQPARARAIYGAATLARTQGDYVEAMKLCEEGLTIYKELGDRKGVAASLNRLGLLAYDQNDYERAVALLKEALAFYREVGDEWGIATSLEYLGIIAFSRRDYDEAVSSQEESLTIRMRLQDKQGIGSSLNVLGLVALDRGDYDRAAGLFEDSCEAFEEVNDKLGIASCTNNLGEVAQNRGDIQQAGALFQKSLVLFESLDNVRGKAIVLNNLGDVARYEGGFDRARRYYSDCLSLRQGIGEKADIASCLDRFAYLAQEEGAFERAAVLFGTAATIREVVGATVSPCDLAEYERKVAATRDGLGEEGFEAAWSQGQTIDHKKATAYALGIRTTV